MTRLDSIRSLEINKARNRSDDPKTPRNPRTIRMHLLCKREDQRWRTRVKSVIEQRRTGVIQARKEKSEG